MDKILSVVIPTYNMEALLDRCLTSFVTVPEVMNKIEVIVVNDGSKDRSSEIAHNYEKQYPNTYIVIDKENGNYGSCVNKGLNECTGKYFRILDADDWIETGNLASFIQVLENTDDDVVFTNHRKIYPDRREESSFPAELRFNESINLDGFDFNIYNMSWFVLMHRITYRTDLLKKINLHLHTGISYTDTEYCFYPLIEAQTMRFLSLVIYNYDCCRDGQTMSLASRIKSLSHMRTILEGMVSEYATVSGKLSDNRKNILFEVFGSLTNCIYHTILVDSSKNKELDQYLSETYDLMKFDTNLINRVSSFSYNNVKCVRVWKKTGLYNTNFIFKVYNHIYYRWMKVRTLFVHA